MNNHITSFKEYLYEMAFSKDVMISKFTNNSDNIFNHILKVLVYNDPFNNKKYLKRDVRYSEVFTKQDDQIKDNSKGLVSYFLWKY